MSEKAIFCEVINDYCFKGDKAEGGNAEGNMCGGHLYRELSGDLETSHVICDLTGFAWYVPARRLVD